MMSSQLELTEHLIQTGYLRSPRIISAFKKIDREDFIPEELTGQAYGNYPLPIGHGQTISQPLTVAFMLELLSAKKGDKILDLGAGSGWTTALLAEIVGRQGQVWGTEIVKPLAKFGQKNLTKYHFAQARVVPSGNKLGLPQEAPFDKILVSAAAESLPKELVRQLVIGGKLVIPIQGSIFKIEKVPASAQTPSRDGSATKTKKQEFPGFAFVPLINSNSHD